MKHLAIALFVLLIAPSLRAAQTQSINPIADTFVAASNPSSNFGAAGGLAVAPASSSKGEFQTVIRFDLSPVKSAFDATFGAGNWRITSASLRLTAALPNNPIFNANAPGQFAVEWMSDDSWIEGTGMPNAPGASGLNFNTLPAVIANGTAPLGTFNFVGGDSGSASYPLALHASFTGDTSTGSLVSLHLLSADSSVQYLFNSRNVSNAANRPELSITADAIPEPGSIVCMTVAAACFRRKPRSS